MCHAGVPLDDVAWTVQTWWALTEAMLRQAASFCARLTLLRQLVTIDVPLHDGNGNLRFR